MRTQKLMWRNIMKSTKSQKASVLHYCIDISFAQHQASITNKYNSKGGFELVV
jgi:hypothetical protein